MQHSYSAPMLAPRSKGPSPLSQPTSIQGTSQFVDRERMRRASSFNSLDAVPEHSQSSHGSPRHRPLPQPTSRQSTAAKGKDRMPSYHDAQPLTDPSAEWVLDMVEAQHGRDRWLERSRVILVLGGRSNGKFLLIEDVSTDSLAPILYNPTFQHTLVIVATSYPVPSIEALASTKGPSDIYPALKPFSLKSSVASQHHLPSLLEHAVELSKTYRSKTRKVGITRRSESFGQNSPPLSPPMLAQSRRGSKTSISEGFDDRSRPASNVSGFDRGSTYRRESFFSLSKMADGSVPEKPSSSTVPFDAVLNFVPQATEKTPQAALQQLLHQAVLSTTGVFPLLCRKSDKGDNGPTITLLHVIPSGCPGPLPSVIESFLLNFQKSFPPGDRPVWAAVAPPSVWRSPAVSNGDDISGAETILFGGVRCPSHLGGRGSKSKAWLPGWSTCLPMPGLLSAPVSTARTRLSQLDTRQNLQAPPPAHVRETHGWPTAYTDYNHLSPADRSPSGFSYPTPPSTSGHSSPIPELDGAHSSSSSTASIDAGVGEMQFDKERRGDLTWQRSEYGVNKPITVVEKKEKNRWWKRSKA